MADLSRLYNFVAGTPAVADQVDAEFDQLIARINDIDADSLQAALAVILGVSQTGVVRRGKSIIGTTEFRTNTVYGLMPTPDRVQNVVVPADAYVLLGYQATWSEQFINTAHAAIFAGANQLKTARATAPSVFPGEAMIGGTAGRDVPLASWGGGLISLNGDPNTPYSGDVTTGQFLGVDNSGAPGGLGLCVIDNLAAGTYDFSIQFKSSSGQIAVKNRRLKVFVIGF